MAEDQVLSGWYEEEANAKEDHKKPLEEPKAVLKVRPWVTCAADTDHHDGHHKEKAGQSQEDAVGREVANDIAAELHHLSGAVKGLMVEVEYGDIEPLAEEAL